MSNRYPGQSAAANVRANRLRARDALHYYKPATPKVVPINTKVPFLGEQEQKSSTGLSGGEMAGVAALVILAVTGIYYLYKHFKNK